MDIEEIRNLNEQGAKINLNSTSELVNIYKNENKPKVKIVIHKRCAYVSLATLNNIQFIVKEIGISSFNFIDRKEIVNLDHEQQGIFRFFIKEFWQGNDNISKSINLLIYFVIIAIFNFLIIHFGTEKNVQFTFTAILSASSIFIAIFSIFIANADIFKSTKSFIFKKGKLAYYFSVDKNMTISGIICIIASLFGLMIVGDSNLYFCKQLEIDNGFEFFSKPYLCLFLLNLSFIFLFIILRSLVEFYVIRPGIFVIGEQKDEFLRNYSD